MRKLLLAVGVLCGLAACTTPRSAEPDYGKPLPHGADALLPLGPDDTPPDFAADWRKRDQILEALDRSIDWVAKPSARTHFPAAGISYERTVASLERFREVLGSSASSAEFARAMEREFEVYKSAGWDGRGGGVLFTAYCTPILDGRLAPDAEYRYPLYALPDDLVKGEGGRILGQRMPDGSLRPYPERRTIEATHMLADKQLELVWLADPLDAYIAHVNGSAVIRLADRSVMRLGYAGKNGREYVSLRNRLLEGDEIREEDANLSGIRRWGSSRDPTVVQRYLNHNPSYVFFTPIEGSPRGSLNVEVTAGRTLATDKSLFPRAAIVFVDAEVGTGARGRPFQQFMFDQDTGGAIRTAGRADIYLGAGLSAERRAGSTRSPGQLYYLFLKDSRARATQHTARADAERSSLAAR